MKNYYQILGVTPTSGGDEIRKKYRDLAMQFHPDRNPDSPDAEERFKDIAEAYGVLTDPVKRREYDTFRGRGGMHSQGSTSEGFNYSQEDILRDLFKDPRFQQMFHGLLREFQRSGFRANKQFIKQSFFGGKGGIFLGGLFLFGSVAGPVILGSARKKLSGKKSLLQTVGSTVGALLGTSGRQDAKQHDATQPDAIQPDAIQPDDITYITSLSAEELKQGKVVQVVTQGPEGQEMLKVTIPPGSREGQKLRLRGKGRQEAQGRGDLFLQLEKK